MPQAGCSGDRAACALRWPLRVHPHRAPPFMLLAGCGGADVLRVAFTAAGPAVRGTREVAALVCPLPMGRASGGSTSV